MTHTSLEAVCGATHRCLTSLQAIQASMAHPTMDSSSCFALPILQFNHFQPTWYQCASSRSHGRLSQAAPKQSMVLKMTRAQGELCTNSEWILVHSQIGAMAKIFQQQGLQKSL